MDENIQAGTALAVLPIASLPTILAADNADILGKLKAELAGYVPDATTPHGRDEIGAKAKKVGVAKQDLLRIAKTLKEDAQKTVKAINAEERVVEERCDAIRDQILAPRKAYEQIEKDRVAAHEAALARLAVNPEMQHASSADLAEAIRQRQGPEARNWQEFHERATAAQKAAIAVLVDWHGEAEQREADAAELERLRAEQAERDRLAAILEQQRREERIAAEAAEKARVHAEAKATVDRIEAERKAMTEQVAAAKREREAQETAQRLRDAAAKADADYRAALVEAANKAERDRTAAVEAERKRVADARAAEDAEEARRMADKAHRAKINNESMSALVAAGLDDKSARAAVVAIAKGAVPHIHISY